MIYIGIHSNQKNHSIACVYKEKNSFCINHLCTLNRDVKPLYTLAGYLEKKSFTVVTGLSTREIFLRDFKYKLKSKRKIRATLSFQIEPLLPFPSEEVILQPIFYPNKECTEVFFIAGSKKSLRDHLEYWEERQVDSDIVSSIPIACFRFAEYFFPNHPSMLIYLLEDEQSTFIAISERKIKLAQSFSLGRKDFSDPSKFSKEIERILAFISAKCPSIQDLLLLGEITSIEEQLAHFFSPKFTLLEMQNPSFASYAPAMGLAFDAAIQDKQSHQFRLKENLSKKSIQTRRKWLRIYFLGCFSALSMIFVLGSFYLHKREKELLVHLNITQESTLSNAIIQLETALETKKKTIVTIPTIPNVSEILAWLSTHPKLQDVSIVHFRYTLTKIPKIGSSVLAYSARIDLELSTPTPRLARSFHEALVTDPEMVDHSHELSWSAQRDIYKTSFFLKSIKPHSFYEKPND